MARSIRNAAFGPGHNSGPIPPTTGSAGLQSGGTCPGPIIAEPARQAAEATEIVVVETDANHRDDDERLRRLLAEHEQQFGERLPFPRTHKLPSATLKRSYRQVTAVPGAPGDWQLQLQVPLDAEVEQPDATSALAGDRPTTLLTIRLAEPLTTIDVLGLPEAARDNVADWLDEWLEQIGMRPFSSRPKRTDDGVMGDVLATGYVDNGIQVARYKAMSISGRTLVLVLRTPLTSYRRIARDFVLAASSLTPASG